MKTIYITEAMAKLLKESILEDTIPVAIIDDIDKTPFVNSPFANASGFFKKVATREFQNARNTLKNMGQIDSVDAKSVEDGLRKLILKCQKIEEPNKNALEKLAVNYVINLFSIPDDKLKIEAQLVNEIEGGDEISPVEPFDGDINFELEDVAEISGIEGEISKRFFINALNMGAGMRMSENVRGYLEDLYDIDSRLPQLYKETIALNNYSIFKSTDLGITDKTRNQIGLVEINYGPQVELITIKAQGVIFPVLLCELIRGLMELFSAHGLPKDKERRDYILSKTDYLKAEPWDMRFGPYMWNIFTEYFENTDTEDMPYIYKVFSKLKPKSFFNVISEMMMKTKKGKMYAEKILEKALDEKEHVSFTNKMAMRNMNKNIITDSYMGPDEF